MKAPVFNADWPDEVMALYHHDVREMWDRSVAPHIWNQYHNQLALYSELAGTHPLDILDVGCAQATLALILAEQGHRVCAMDVRQPFLDYAASRYEKGEIRFSCGNAMTDEPGGQFDLIFANQIMEHLVYPERLLQRLHGWLRPGGRLIATTPNGQYLVNRLPTFSELGDRTRYEHLQYTADGDGHFFAYVAPELEALFEGAGLVGVQVRHFESPWISGHMKLRFLHPVLPGVALRALDRTLLSIPAVGRRFAHQLMAIGTKSALSA